MQIKKSLLGACVAALGLLNGAQASDVEVRFYPPAQIWSHPLENARDIHSVVVQNTAIINHTSDPVTLQTLQLDLLDNNDDVLQSRFFDAAKLDALAKAGAGLGASGMLQLVDFHFAPKQLFGSVTPLLSAQRTLAPGAAFYLGHQFLAFNGEAAQLRVRAEFAATSVPAKARPQLGSAHAALKIRHGSAPGRYRFPLAGHWWVGAGATAHTAHRWAVPEEFALDILRIGAHGLTYRGKGTKMRDYYAYGASVLAAADGEVVFVLDGVPDNTAMLRREKESLHHFQQRLFASQAQLLTNARENVPGNHVILRHDAEGGPVFSVYAHLQPFSIAVKVGQQVKVGAQIGKLGGSGNSTEPHLHFHLCDRPDALNCSGIPVHFENVEIPLSDGDRAIQSGDIVLAVPALEPSSRRR